MGREEKRTRERATKLLAKRLKRQPTEDEIDKDIASLQEAHGLAPQPGREAARTATPKSSRRPR